MLQVPELSQYVADMCGDLTAMASSARLPVLAYLLSMARQEAERVARGGSDPDWPAGSGFP